MESILNNIFSPQFVFTILRVSTPLIFAGMAALVVKKGGIICIAFEGMMLFAALGGVVGSAYSQSLIVGAIAGVLSGVLIASIFSYFVLVLKSNPVLTGLALNIFGSGATVFILFVLTGNKGTSSSLQSLRFPVVELPLIKDIPIVGTILSGHNLLTYVSLITVALVYVFIYKTTLGLRIRSVGENPHAAESVGIKVIRTQFITLMIGGAIASLGGMYISMGYLPFFTRDMISGRGFIGIAAQNLGGGIPLFTLIAAMFFGTADAIANVFQTLRVPAEFMQMLPYVVTLIGLMFVGGFTKESKQKTNTLNKIKEKKL